MPVKLITFDLDYTLWDPTASLIAAEEAMYAWIREHSPVTASFYPPEKMREYKNWLAASYPEMAGRVSELRTETLRRVFMQSGHDRDSARDMAAAAFAAFFQARSEGLELFDGVHNALSTLGSDMTLMAITNGNADLKKAGHAGYFSAHFNADQHGRAKPAPDMFLAALSQAGVSASEAIHIGDHEEQDIAAAAALGMKTLWFNPQQKAWPLSEVTPDDEFSHWSQLVQKVQALGGN